jgi:3-isopropylmalate dehydrogenase
MVLSAVMMLEHLNENEIANRIRKATEDDFAEGKVRANDMLKMKGTQNVVNQGAASTKQMADAIIAKLKSFLLKQTKAVRDGAAFLLKKL